MFNVPVRTSCTLNSSREPRRVVSVHSVEGMAGSGESEHVEGKKKFLLGKNNLIPSHLCTIVVRSTVYLPAAMLRVEDHDMYAVSRLAASWRLYGSHGFP